MASSYYATLRTGHITLMTVNNITYDELYCVHFFNIDHYIESRREIRNFIEPVSDINKDVTKIFVFSHTSEVKLFI